MSAPDRAYVLLGGLAIDRLTGLEIGPLDRPIVERRDGRRIFYADYDTRIALVAKSKADPGVEIDRIPEIDFLISPPPPSLGMNFDYIVASHVAEHVPNLIGWLNTLLGWLNEDGVIVLALPDKRYTFDCHRPMSTLGELVGAHLEGRTRPSAATVYDALSGAVRVDPAKLYDEIAPPQPFEPYFSTEQALYTARRTVDEAAYIDCHCWVFSDDHFVHLMDEARRIGLTNARVTELVRPGGYACEFFVRLRRGQPVIAP